MINYPFVEKTPTHRLNPPVYASYSQYRNLLISDFNKRCAYCNDSHRYRIRSFAIDHFVPKIPENCISTIPHNKYDNLIYSCPYCNRAKWNKWPTNDDSVHNNGIIGFVKPTDPIYKSMFIRSREGRIIPIENNSLAIYIKNELMLWNPIHSLMWKIEKLMNLDLKVRLKLSEINNEELLRLHYMITNEVTSIFRFITDFND